MPCRILLHMWVSEAAGIDSSFLNSLYRFRETKNRERNGRVILSGGKHDIIGIGACLTHVVVFLCLILPGTLQFSIYLGQ